MSWRDMDQFRNPPVLPAAAETPIETYAREGKLMTGCLWGSKYQMKKIAKRSGKGAAETYELDAQGQKILLIKCGKVCNAGERFCPKHKLQNEMKEQTA